MASTPVPAPHGNAFAQQKEMARLKSLQDASSGDQGPNTLTEIKPPVPPKPTSTTSHIDGGFSLPVPKPSKIQPVIPLVNPGDKNKPGRDNEASSSRAVTDPILKHQSAMPNPLFYESDTKDAKPKGTKSKFSIKPNKKGNTQNIPTASEKAAKVLGGTASPQKKSEDGKERGGKAPQPKRDVTQLSAPASTQAAGDFRVSTDVTTTDRDVSPSRQVRSQPGTASKRFYLENMGPNTPTIVPASFATGPSSNNHTQESYKAGEEDATPKPKVQGMMLGDPSTSPTRQGTYGKVGNAQLHTFPSIQSMHGDINDVPSTYLRLEPSVESFHSRLSPFAPPPMPMLLPHVYQPGRESALYQPGPFHLPAEHSPSIYDIPGAWEEMRNVHPNSMPPFQSPSSEHLSQGSILEPPPLYPFYGDRTPSGMTTRSYPIVFQGHPNEMTPADPHPPSFGDRSRQPSNRSTGHGGYVPTPNHPDFQAGGRIADQMQLSFTTLQYHVDDEVRKFTQIIRDSKDEILDKTICRFDALDAKCTQTNKNVAALVQEVKKLNEAVTNVLTRFSTAQLVKPPPEVVQKLKDIDARMNALQVTIENVENEVKNFELTMTYDGPCIVDGSNTRHKSEEIKNSSSSAATPPQNTHAAGSVTTPVAAYPTPAHGNPGVYVPPMILGGTAYGSNFDPNTYALTPAPPNVNANHVQTAASGVERGHRFASQDIRFHSEPNVSTPTRRPSNYNNNVSYQSQGRHYQGQDQRGYNSRRGNDGSHYPPCGRRDRTDTRNVSTGNTIYAGDRNMPEPDIRDHPAFAQSASDLTASPTDVNSFNQQGHTIPVIGADTATAHTPVPGKPMVNLPTHNGNETLWAAPSQGWSGGNWYNAAYGQDGQGNNQGQGSRHGDDSRAGNRDASGGEKQLYNWSAPGTQAYSSHRDIGGNAGTGLGNNAGSGTVSASAPGTPHGRKQSQNQSNNQNQNENAHGRKQSKGRNAVQNHGQGSAYGHHPTHHVHRRGSNQHSPNKGAGDTSKDEGKTGGKGRGGWKQKGPGWKKDGDTSSSGAGASSAVALSGSGN
jgi:hypothetical protein